MAWNGRSCWKLYLAQKIRYLRIKSHRCVVAFYCALCSALFCLQNNMKRSFFFLIDIFCPWVSIPSAYKGQHA